MKNLKMVSTSERYKDGERNYTYLLEGFDGEKVLWKTSDDGGTFYMVLDEYREDSYLSESKKLKHIGTYLGDYLASKYDYEDEEQQFEVATSWGRLLFDDSDNVQVYFDKPVWMVVSTIGDEDVLAKINYISASLEFIDIHMNGTWYERLIMDIDSMDLLGENKEG